MFAREIISHAVRGERGDLLAGWPRVSWSNLFPMRKGRPLSTSAGFIGPASSTHMLTLDLFSFGRDQNQPRLSTLRALTCETEQANARIRG